MKQADVQLRVVAEEKWNFQNSHFFFHTPIEERNFLKHKFYYFYESKYREFSMFNFRDDAKIYPFW